MEPQAPPLGKHQPPRQCENTGEIISPHPQKLTWATPTNVASQQLEHVGVTDIVIPEGNGVDWLPQLPGEGPRDMPEVLRNQPHGWLVFPVALVVPSHALSLAANALSAVAHALLRVAVQTPRVDPGSYSSPGMAPFGPPGSWTLRAATPFPTSWTWCCWTMAPRPSTPRSSLRSG